MSYEPINDSEEQSKIIHRHPLYPSLKYPQPQPVNTLCTQCSNKRILNNIISISSATTLL